MHKKQVSVEDLQLGMFVVELDRPWLGTPFDSRGFVITTREQIEALRAHCRSVYVDPARQSWFGQPMERRAYRGPIIPTPIERELLIARDVYDGYAQAVKRSLEAVHNEGSFEAENLTVAAARMAASMQRNPDAMLLVDSVQEKRSRELERALSSSIRMMAFGAFLELEKARLEVLGLAGVLLDVGKTCVSDAVLNKPGMLTADEYQAVKGHVMHSVELLRAGTGGLPEGVDEVILQHHERQDGSGYPHGLKADRISKEGAMAGIVDSFSAMTLRRAFAEPRSASSALSLLRTMRGKCFDESLIERFVECVGKYPVGTAVELNTGEAGIVIAHNPARRLEPRLMLVLDAGGDAVLSPEPVLDLADDPESDSGEPYRIRRALPLSTLPVSAVRSLLPRLCASGASGQLMGSVRSGRGLE